MTLLRFIQKASILAGVTFASFSVYSSPAHADDPQFCVITNNGKTACGTLKTVERGCVATAAGSTVCGKFNTAKEAQAQGEAKTPAPIAAYRKEVGSFVYTLEGCQRVDTSVRCQIKIVNKGKERDIYSDAPYSSLVDPTGKSHPGSTVDLGGSPTVNTRSIIVPGTDAYFGITFENLPGSVMKAQLLNLAIGDKPIQFRNIPITN